MPPENDPQREVRQDAREASQNVRERAQNAIDIPVPWSAAPLHVTGVAALALIIYLATAWYFRDLINTGNRDRAAEHEEQICDQNMEIFLHQFPRGEVDWEQLPATLYRCLPEYQRKLKVIKK